MKYKKGTFIVVPNIELLSGKPTELQTIFMWICSYANDEGQCFPSRKALASKCAITVKTLDKYMEQLIEFGLIEKTHRKKEGTKENTSNLYQVLLPDIQPSVNEDPTGSHPNDPVTIPSINYTNLTTITEEVKVTLPLQRGKQPSSRLLSIYSDLFKDVFGFSYKSNFGRDLKIIKDMLQNYSELQIARMMIIFFSWHGMTGSDDREYNFLVGATFSLGLFKVNASKYEVYSRNVLKEDFDSDEKLLTEVGNYFIKVINIDKVSIKV
jgi:predicted transcriptional regulator